MPRVGRRRRRGSGAGEAGEADAEAREVAEMRELQGEAGAPDADRKRDQCRRSFWRGDAEEFGALRGAVPE